MELTLRQSPLTLIMSLKDDAEIPNFKAHFKELIHPWEGHIEKVDPTEWIITLVAHDQDTLYRLEETLYFGIQKHYGAIKVIDATGATVQKEPINEA
jgi:hypothetical protein